MLIYDFFAGEGGKQRRGVVESRGHKYITIDNNPKFGCSITADILKMQPSDFSPSSFWWSSPPCEGLSVASIGKHWRIINNEHIPQTETAKTAVRLVKHFLYLVEEVNPVHGWLLENPRGKLRSLPFMKKYNRHTVTYCQYGEARMKPTDIWGVLPGWYPRQMCKNGDPCHEPAPRGSKTGTQGIQGASARAVVPLDLWCEIMDVLEGVRLTSRCTGQGQQLPLPVN